MTRVALWYSCSTPRINQFVEVVDVATARSILQRKQDKVLEGKSKARARPCLMTLSSHAALIEEVKGISCIRSTWRADKFVVPRFDLVDHPSCSACSTCAKLQSKTSLYLRLIRPLSSRWNPPTRPVWSLHRPAIIPPTTTNIVSKPSPTPSMVDSSKIDTLPSGTR